MADLDRAPCCENSSRPFAPHIFDECLPHSISSLYATPREMFVPGVAGPKFRQQQPQPVEDNKQQHAQTISNKVNRETSKPAHLAPGPPSFDAGPPLVGALIVEFDSSQSNTKAYTDIRTFVAQVDAWLAEQLKTAPEAMRGAFFTSELDFYDLQDTLSRGTWTAIAVSMGIALVVLFLVTLNVLLSLFAILTVTLTICTTVAVLVLLGWQLNVLESVAVSTAIGLAVDFSLHYGVHFQMAEERTRLVATRYALCRMVGPTAMAALTTAAAGAFMLPSDVLAYIQIGVFLVVVMVTSWLYATFFLMSLLCVAGPQFGFGQFRCWRGRGRSGAGSGRGSAGGDLGGCGGELGRGNEIGGGGGGAGGIGCQTHNKGMLLENSGMSSQNPVSEQLLSASSSAAGEMEMAGSESHELDSLTSNSVVKAPSQIECSRPINFDRAFKSRQLHGGGGGGIQPSPTTSATIVLPEEMD